MALDLFSAKYACSTFHCLFIHIHNYSLYMKASCEIHCLGMSYTRLHEPNNRDANGNSRVLLYFVQHLYNHRQSAESACIPPESGLWTFAKRFTLGAIKKEISPTLKGLYFFFILKLYWHIFTAKNQLLISIYLKIYIIYIIISCTFVQN